MFQEGSPLSLADLQPSKVSQWPEWHLALGSLARTGAWQH